MNAIQNTIFGARGCVSLSKLKQSSVMLTDFDTNIVAFLCFSTLRSPDKNVDSSYI